MSGDETIGWPHLVLLMAVGDGPDPSLAGTIHIRNPSHVIVADAAGSAEFEDFHMRVWKREELSRIETMDGQPTLIKGAETVWVWEEGQNLPIAMPRATSAWGSPWSGLLERRALASWDGNDFTKPTGPILATHFLDRTAWRVELAPPPHKPFALTLVVDSATGLVLQEHNAGFDSVSEWVELRFGEDLPTEMFVWAGQARSPTDQQAEQDGIMAARSAWLEQRGIGQLELTIGPDLRLNEWDDDSGAFQAAFHASMSGSLVRYPLADADPDLRQNWPFSYRWSDHSWNWFLGIDREILADELALVQSQLRDTR
jgi:hypothetical protein